MSSSSRKFYTHTCRECGLNFRMLLPTGRRTVFRLRCPDCRTRIFLDNRDGGLHLLRRQRLLSRPIREYYLQPGVDYVDPRPAPAPALELAPSLSDAPPAGQREPDQAAPGAQKARAPADCATLLIGAGSRPTKIRWLDRVGGIRGRMRGEVDRLVSLFYLALYRTGNSGQRAWLAVQNGGARGRTWLAQVCMAAWRQTRGASIGLARGLAWPVVTLATALATIPPRVRDFVTTRWRGAVQSTRRNFRMAGVRLGDLRTGVAMRLISSRWLPGATFERVADVGISIFDSGHLRALRLRSRLARLRELLWPAHISRRVLVGLYTGGPLVLLCIYMGAAFYFPALALPESMSSLEAHLLPVQPNRILDRNGGLLAELFARKTSNIDFARGDFPRSLQRKLLFIEDETFYEHGGVRPLAILRAFARNVAAGRYVEGGSTITQQVARIALRKRDRSLSRKFQEAVLGRQLEHRLTKDEILNAYVNHVYMGHGAYGMEVAADFYFGRDLKELNFSEELMLVTLLPAPADFSPLRNPARLEQRMDLLYNRMVKENFPRIPADLYRHQKNRLFAGFDQSPNQSVFGSRTNRAPYVAEYVRIALKRLPYQDDAAYDLSHGLTIQTTIDAPLQIAATLETPAYMGDIDPYYPPYQIVEGKPVPRTDLRAALREEYARARLGLQILGMPAPVSKSPHLEAAAIGIEPATGAVLFMQGGASFRSSSQLNHAIAMRRQTGSAIKPIVFSAGIESGRVSPATILMDEPFPEDGPGPEEDPQWKPHNYRDDYHGRVSVRFALERSLNIPTIRVAQLTGMSRLAMQFQKFFFPTRQAFQRRFRRDLTVAIGSLEMSPLEMALAYSAFANNGVIHRPYLIEKVTASDGRVIFSRSNSDTGSAFDEFGLQIPAERTVLSGDVAEVMASLLKDSARRGGAGYWSRFTLGKTGTSNDYRDAWFVGVLPDVSAAVWIGYDDPANSMGRATGSAVAGPLWGRIIGKGMINRSPGKFQFSPRATHHEVCTKSGGRATPQCPHRRTEIFPRQHPPGRCWKHGD